MSKIERADRQTSPLVEGRFYLVPTVRAKWFDKLTDWPVIGPLHEDREIFGFDQDHYHIDARFLPRTYRRIYRVFQYALHAHYWAHHFAANEGKPPPVLPAPVLLKRKCIRSHVPYDPPWERAAVPIGTLRKAFAGHQCAAGKGGWICPHRKASLGSIQPVGGVITCPLHGLRIDAVDGKVLPP